MMEILLDNLALALGGALIIAAFVRHLVTKDPGQNRPVDDGDYEDERGDWWMNSGNDMGFFERHDD